MHARSWLRSLGLGLARGTFAACALFASPAACTSGCEDTIEDAGNANVVKEQYEVLMDAKGYLDSHKDELEQLTSGDGKAVLRRAGRLSELLSEINEQLEAAQAAVRKVEGTGIRFNSALFRDLNRGINRALEKVNPSSDAISQLHELAQDVRESREGWGFTIRGLKKEGIAPQAVIDLSNKVKEIRKSLIGFKKGVAEISSDEVEGYSTNDFVNGRLKDEVGPCFPPPRTIDDFDHLKPGTRSKEVVELQKLLAWGGYFDSLPYGTYDERTRTAHRRAKVSIGMFCAMWPDGRALVDEEDILSKRLLVKSIQRAMINKGYLPPGSDDGKIGPMSKKAARKAAEDGLPDRLKKDCKSYQGMLRASVDDMDDVVFDFGIAFGYMPPDIRERDSEERECFAKAMAESRSFMRLMTQTWE